MASLSEEKLKDLCGPCYKNPDRGAWDCLTDDQKKIYRDFQEEMQHGIGRPMTIQSLCPRCEITREMHRKRRENRGIIATLVSDGLIQTEKIESYLDVWPEAEAQNPAAWELARRYKPSMGSLFIYGPEGVGKTALGRFLLMRQVLYQGRNVAEVPAHYLESKPRNFKTDRFWERVSAVPLMLLDDISSVAFSAKGLSSLFQLIDRRATLGVATVVTSNKSLNDVYKALHAAAQDYAQNASLATSTLRRLRPIREIHMTGESLRKLLEFNEDA